MESLKKRTLRLESLENRVLLSATPLSASLTPIPPTGTQAVYWTETISLGANESTTITLDTAGLDSISLLGSNPGISISYNLSNTSGNTTGDLEVTGSPGDKNVTLTLSNSAKTNKDITLYAVGNGYLETELLGASNDNSQQTLDLSSNQAVVMGEIGGEDTIDWYQITASGTANFQLHSFDGARLSLALYNADGTLLAQSTSVDDFNSVLSSVKLDRDATYYLCVTTSDTSASAGKYALTVTKDCIVETSTEAESSLINHLNASDVGLGAVGGEDVNTTQTSFDGQTIRAFSVSESRMAVVTGSEDSATLQLWEYSASAWKKLAETTITLSTENLKISVSGDSILVGGESTTIYTLNGTSFNTANLNVADSTAVLLQGDYAFVSTSEGVQVFQNTNGWSPLETLSNTDSASVLAWDATTSRLCVGNGKTVSIYSIGASNQLESTYTVENDVTAIALSGNTLAVSCKKEGTPTVAIYSYSDGKWNFVVDLQAPEGSTESNFGGSISLSGTQLAVGSNATTNSTTNDDVGTTGAVYLYRAIGNEWKLERTIQCNESDNALGTAVVLNANRLDVYDSLQNQVYTFTNFSNIDRWTLNVTGYVDSNGKQPDVTFTLSAQKEGGALPNVEILDPDGNPVTVTETEEGNYTFTPTTTGEYTILLFAENTTNTLYYQLNVTSGAFAEYQNAKVVSISPEKSSNCIIVEYSQQILASSLESATATLGGKSLTLSSILDGNKVVLKVPDNDVSNGTYDLKISGLESVSGETITEFQTTYEYVPDTVAPEINSIIIDKEKGEAIITFSEPVETIDFTWIGEGINENRIKYNGKWSYSGEKLTVQWDVSTLGASEYTFFISSFSDGANNEKIYTDATKPVEWKSIMDGAFAYSATVKGYATKDNPVTFDVSTVDGKKLLQNVPVGIDAMLDEENKTLTVSTEKEEGVAFSIDLLCNATLESSDNSITLSSLVEEENIKQICVLGVLETAGETDVYEFSVSQDCVFSATLAGEITGNVTLKLYKVQEDKDVLITASNSATDTIDAIKAQIQNVKTLDPSETVYRLEVSATGTGEYRLVVTENALFNGITDGAQKNAVLLDGQNAVIGYVGGNQCDYYCFTANEDTIAISLLESVTYSNDTAVPFNVTLIDTDKNEISAVTTDNETYSYEVSKGDIYYLKLSTGTDTAMDYVLKVDGIASKSLTLDNPSIVVDGKSSTETLTKRPTSITLNFSDKIRQDKLSLESIWIMNGNTKIEAENYTVSEDGKSVTFQFADATVYSTTAPELKINANAFCTLAGDEFTGDETVSLQMESASVTAQRLRASEGSVSLTWTFSEEVTEPTGWKNVVSVTQNGKNITTSGTFSYNNRVLTWTATNVDTIQTGATLKTTLSDQITTVSGVPFIAFEKEFIVNLESSAETKLGVRTESSLSLVDSANATVETLPENAKWVHEWNTIWVEVWARVVSTTENGLTRYEAEISYDPTLFTPFNAEGKITFKYKSDVFDVNIVIDKEKNTLKITATVKTGKESVGYSNTNETDASYALIASIQFLPQNGVDIQFEDDGGTHKPADLGIGFVENSITIQDANSQLSSYNTEDKTGALPAVYPVVYDLNDDGSIDITDLVQFARNFGKDSSACNFDDQDDVGINDLVFFARNFLKKGNDITLSSSLTEKWGFATEPTPTASISVAEVASPALVSEMASENIEAEKTETQLLQTVGNVTASAGSAFMPYAVQEAEERKRQETELRAQLLEETLVNAEQTFSNAPETERNDETTQDVAMLEFLTETEMDADIEYEWDFSVNDMENMN